MFRIIASLAFFIISATSAHAALVTVNISGDIASITAESIDTNANTRTPINIYDPTTGPFDVGDGFLISLDVTSASGPTPFVTGTSYDLAFTASFGDYMIEDARGDLVIDDDRPDGDFVFFSVLPSGVVSPSQGGAVAGLPFSNINFSFENYDMSAFSDELLTADKFLLSNFDGAFGSLVFSMRDDEDPDTIIALTVLLNTQSIDLVTSEVPLPAAFPLMLSALGLFGAVSRKKSNA
ncbi:VPLPA-CTERM sorting domain-containing protein [Hyphococcus sp.]|jgi:hypothetical protein|uniref:VPLPA-CTERM sorting domain-containing protein n=1 Tax=Hyphococcus sp. TaxID=2038636 RepID=UPI003D0C7C14